MFSGSPIVKTQTAIGRTAVELLNRLSEGLQRVDNLRVAELTDEAIEATELVKCSMGAA